MSVVVLLVNDMAEMERLENLSNAELVRECLARDEADALIVQEMMTRLHPGWEFEEQS